MSKTIAVIDDTIENLKLIETILLQNGFEVRLFPKPDMALRSLKSNPPDLVLIDIMMPSMDGFELHRALGKFPAYSTVPFIYLSARSEVDSKVKAFKNGGVDYITKPFVEEELISRINYHLKAFSLQNELFLSNQTLEKKVSDRTQEVESMTLSLISALENANLYNDEMTGNHIKRVAEYSAILAFNYGLDGEFVKKIKLFAPLHDIGKVGIPDAILKKPGKYTNEEFNAMKKHVLIGYNMLKDSSLSNIAKNIIYYHHEKWDGTGYVNRLKKEKIPIESRIVAISDVFDALSSKRSYKDAFSIDKTLEIMKEGKGTHFDPELLDVFLGKINEILIIKEKNRDLV